jgi:nickel-type superoxide dismutase maturation protease
MSLGTLPANASLTRSEFPLTFRDLLLWLLRRRRWFRVSGPSMSPTFEDGDFALVDVHAYRSISPKVGDVVVAHHPIRHDTMVVKRVNQVDKDGLHLHGDCSSQSQDSRSLGRFKLQSIMGRVVGRLS